MHIAKPGDQMPAVDSTKPSAEEEGLDNRYLEGDYSEVDPAILEKLAVYIARYSYDPVQHSPNENPEMELAFQAGDYLYVFGEMDEVRAVFELNFFSLEVCLGDRQEQKVQVFINFVLLKDAMFAQPVCIEFKQVEKV